MSFAFNDSANRQYRSIVVEDSGKAKMEQVSLKRPILFLTFLFHVLLISACGGGGSSALPPLPNNPEDDQGGQPGNDPSFPYSGTVILDEYKSFSVSDANLGVIELTLSPLNKTRLFSGSLPRRSASGALTFREPCAQRSHRIMLLDAGQTIARPITSCSNTVQINRFGTTNFGVSALSPNSDQVVVEAIYISNGETRVAIIVYDIATADRLAFWDNFGAPLWLRDGRLLMTSTNGFYISRVDQETPEKFPDGLSSSVNNPALHPTKDTVAFEYNQQIWSMNLDGTDVKSEISGGSRLAFPTWSPDGNSLLYLQIPRTNKIDRALYFTNLNTMTSYTLALEPVLDTLDTITVAGPISWY